VRRGGVVSLSGDAVLETQGKACRRDARYVSP
jgi:hypothetical protein